MFISYINLILTHEQPIFPCRREACSAGSCVAKLSPQPGLHPELVLCSCRAHRVCLVEIRRARWKLAVEAGCGGCRRGRWSRTQPQGETLKEVQKRLCHLHRKGTPRLWEKLGMSLKNASPLIPGEKKKKSPLGFVLTYHLLRQQHMTNHQLLHNLCQNNVSFGSAVCSFQTLSTGPLILLVQQPPQGMAGTFPPTFQAG